MTMVTCEMRRGALCTMLVLLIALSCCLTIIMTEWLNDGEIKVITSTTVQIFLLFVISMAITVMISIFVLNAFCGLGIYRQRGKDYSLIPGEDQFTNSSSIRHCLTTEVTPQQENTAKNSFMYGLINYAPLILFGLCAILLDVVFEAPSAFHCLAVLDNNKANISRMPEKVEGALGDIRRHYNLVIAYAFIKGACISLQVTFLCKFAKHTVKIGGGVSGIRVTVIIVLLANVSIFLYAFFREMKEHSGIGTYQPDIDADVLQLITQKDILACYADNSTYQEKSETDSRYFYPFEIEFCLASVGLLLSLTNSVHNQDVSSRHDEYDSIGSTEDSGASQQRQDKAHHHHSRAQYGTMMDAEVRSEESNTESRHPIQTNSSCEILGIMLGFICSVPVSIVEGLSIGGDSIFQNIESAEYILTLIHYFGLLLAAGLVSSIVRNSISSRALKISTSNILLIFGATGDVTYAFLLLMPATTAFDSTRLDKMMKMEAFMSLTRETVVDRSSLIFSTNLIAIMQIYLQTFLLIAVSSKHFKWSSMQGSKKSTLKVLLQFIGMANFINWLNQSFLEFPLFQNIPFHNIIYSKPVWTGLLQILFPISLFYRFHSVHTLLEVYVKCNTDNSSPKNQDSTTGANRSTPLSFGRRLSL